MAQDLLAEALRYASYGWKIVPLHDISSGHCSCNKGEDCPSPGKHPRVKDWPNLASNAEDQIIQWWEKWPSANIGVRLGEQSNLIDIEADDEEAERTFFELFDGNPPITPTYKSRRGKHRLFKWKGNLPGGTRGVFKIGNLEFRTGNSNKGMQSVLPPSVHGKTKQVYTWLVHPCDCEIAELPQKVIIRAYNNPEPAVSSGTFSNTNGNGKSQASARMSLYDTAGVGEGNRDNVIYAQACSIWRDQFIIHGEGAFDDERIQAKVYTELSVWNTAKCKPPLDKDVILQKSDGAKQFIRSTSDQYRTKDEHSALVSLGLEWRDGEWWPGRWRAETIDSDPRMVRLFTPALAEIARCDNARKPYVEMTSTDFQKHDYLNDVMLDATGDLILEKYPGFFKDIWNGTPPRKNEPPTVGLRSKLMLDAAKLNASEETKREYVIAERLQSVLATSNQLSEEGEADVYGRPCRDMDGNYWFKFNKVWEPLYKTDDKVGRSELSDLLIGILGVTKKRIVVGGRRVRLMFLGADKYKRLDNYLLEGRRTAGATGDDEEDEGPSTIPLAIG